MLIYEKDNKLNISFENNMDETDIVVGKDEVKIGESTISDSNVLPIPEEGDTGKVPTVQEDGSYALAEASGGSGGVFYADMTVDGGGNYVLDKTWQEIADAIIAKTPAYITISDTVNDYYALWPINGAMYDRGIYSVIFSTDGSGNGPSGVVLLETSAKNGYPKYTPA